MWNSVTLIKLLFTVRILAEAISYSAASGTSKGRFYWQDTKLNFKHKPSKEMGDINFKFNANADCAGVIIIQQITHPITKVSHLLPYRPVVVVDCEFKDFRRLNSSEPYAIHFVKNLKNNDDISPAIIISGQYLSPDKKIIISGKAVTISSFTDSSNYVNTLTRWVNIQEKKFDKEHFTLGIFDYRFENYVDYFRTYANQLPFSSTTLLQMVPLGSVVGDQAITSADREYSSAYFDYRYCGDTGEQRFCNGKPFVGKTSGYISGREEYNQEIGYSINHLFSSSNFSLSGLPNEGKDSRSYRTIIRQTAEYENGVFTKACCMNTGMAAWVEDSGTERKTKNSVGNELPHEVGHTYGLPDWSGSLTARQKTKSYQLNRDLSISMPFLKNGFYKRSSMNGGEGDSTDRLFTSFSDWENAVIVQELKAFPKIDPEIHMDVSRDGKEPTTTRTILLLISGKDMEMYQLNCFIPYKIDQAQTTSSTSYDYVIVNIYDKNGDSKWNKTYNVNNGKFKLVALPHQYIDYSGWIGVQRPRVKLDMKYFVRNDALELPKAIQYPHTDDLFSVNVFKWPQSKIFNLKSSQEINEIFGKYFQIVVKLQHNGIQWKNVTLPFIQVGTQKSMCIYNYQKSNVIINGNIIKPEEGLTVLIHNRWTEVPLPSNETWHKLNSTKMENLYKNPKSLNTYLNTHDVIVFTTYNSRQFSPISLIVPSPQNMNKTIVFEVKSEKSVSVEVNSEAIRNIEKGETVAFSFKEDHSFMRFSIEHRVK